MTEIRATPQRLNEGTSAKAPGDGAIRKGPSPAA